MLFNIVKPSDWIAGINKIISTLCNNVKWYCQNVNGMYILVHLEQSRNKYGSFFLFFLSGVISITYTTAHSACAVLYFYTKEKKPAHAMLLDH